MLTLSGLSKEQQELWSRVVQLWELSKMRDQDQIASALHPDYVGWDMRVAETHDRKAAVLAVSAGSPALREYQLHPLSVKIYAGQTGVVHYAYNATIVAEQVAPMSVAGKWTEVYVKQGGTWLMVAVSGRPETETPA